MVLAPRALLTRACDWWRGQGVSVALPLTMNIMNIDDALPPNDGGHLSSIVPAISDGMRCQADAMNNNYRNGLTMRNSYSEARVCNDHELSEAPSPPAVAACTHAKPAALGLSISTAAVPALRHSLAMYIALGP